MITLGLINALVCCICWGMTIRIILIRRFRDTKAVINHNLYAFVLMVINLFIVIPLFFYLFTFIPFYSVIWHLIVLAAVVDILSTFNLILFCIYSCFTRMNRCPANVQIIIVLGAAINNGHVSPVLASRLNHAVHCWQKHPQAKVIVSGGKAQSERLSEAAAMTNYLVTHGIPLVKIIQEPHARNTRQNLLFSSRLIASPTAQVVVVTSDFHVLRAHLDAKKIGLHWHFLGTKTPWPFRALTFIRDYLGILRDHRWLAGSILLVGVIIAELLLT